MLRKFRKIKIPLNKQLCMRTPFLMSTQPAYSSAAMMTNQIMGISEIRDPSIDKQILALCTNIKIDDQNQDKNDEIIQKIIGKLKKLPSLQQHSLFQPILAQIKLRAISQQNCDKYQHFVQMVCNKILNSLPSLKDLYYKKLVNKSEDLNKSVEMIMNMSLWLERCPQEKRKQLINKLCRVIEAHLGSMNSGILGCLFADLIYFNIKLPYQFLNKLFMQANLQMMNHKNRYYLLKFACQQLEMRYIIPLIELKKMEFTDLIKNNHELTDHQLIHHVNLFVMEIELFHRTKYILKNSQFNKKLSFIERILNDKHIYGLPVMIIYNKLSTLFFIGKRFVREIQQVREVSLTRDEIPIVKQFTVRMLKNFQIKYIYSIEESCVGEVSYPLIGLISNLTLDLLRLEPIFALELTNFLAHDLFKSYKYIKVFSLLSQNFDTSLSSNLNNIQKLVHLLFVNRIFVKTMSSLFGPIISQFCNLPTIPPKSPLWQCLFKILVLNKTTESDNNPQIQLFQKFVIPEIDNQKPRTELVKQTLFYQIYVLQIANLMEKEYFEKNQEIATKLAAYIDQHFIYTVKSVLRGAILDILNLLNKLPPVSPIIHAYLYSNISSFIVFVQHQKKFYLTKGIGEASHQTYENLLQLALNNCLHLRKIDNQDRLDVLQLLALKQNYLLTSTDLVKLMIIMKDPFVVNNKILQKITETQFTQGDLNGFDLSFFHPYKMFNKSLSHLLGETNQQNKGLSNLRSKSEKQIKTLFNQKIAYKTVFENKEFEDEHLVPEPVDGVQESKTLYMCLKIAEKIRKIKDYSIWRADENTQDVDLESEMKYMKDNKLIKLDDFNDFKLGNIEVHGNYEMVQGFNFYEIYQNLIPIDYTASSNLHLAHLENILVALSGNYQIINTLVKKGAFHSQILLKCLKEGYITGTNGSLIKIQVEENGQELYVLCSTQSTYKLHMIYALILERMGLKVCQVEEHTSFTEFKAYLDQILGETYNNSDNEFD